MGSNLTKFEESIKGSLDSFELPYEPKQWDALEKRLDGAAQSSSSNYVMFAWAAAGIIAVTGLFLYFNLSDSAFEGMMADQCVQIKEPVAKDRFVRSILQTPEETASTIEHTEQIDTNSEQPETSEAGLTEQVSDQERSSTTESSNDVAEVNSDDNNDNSDNPPLIAEGNADNAIAFVSNIKEACVGVIVEFELTKGQVEGTRLWNFGDGNFSSQANPSHVFKEPGVYDITLSVKGDDGRIHVIEMEDMIVINPKPNAEFEWSFVNEPGEVPSVEFTNKSARANTSEWVFDDLEGTTEINPTRSFVQRGKHDIQLTVTNEYGCVDDVHHYISIEDDYKLNAKKSFTPNGDGRNDTFIPQALIDNKMRFKMTIYDDKQPIYETTSSRKPWDGKIGNEIAPSADYPWVVIIYNHKNEEQQYFSGTITITP